MIKAIERVRAEMRPTSMFTGCAVAMLLDIIEAEVAGCEQVVHCRDCRHVDVPDWDNVLAEQYGDPPLYCMRLSDNEWRQDGDRKVVETGFLEVSPDDYCAWGRTAEVGG